MLSEIVGPKGRLIFVVVLCLLFLVGLESFN